MGQNDQPDTRSSSGSDFTTGTSNGVSSKHQNIGPYRILELVGTGGMGEVYRAEQVHPIRRTVALKIIKRGMDTKEVMARFETERQALALMDHPNIARVFEAGSTPRGRPYFAMEYVKGIPVNKYCDEHKLSVRERLGLFIQLCEGVQHAHQKAIIHRDLKPSNVLVTIQGSKAIPKIIDFGVAKATAQKLTEKTMYTALGEMIGTPDYMSPEQATMTGEDIDTRTDVYALGVILYELLAGALPFEPTELRKAGFEGLVRMIREKDPPRPSTRVSTLADGGAEAAKARRTFPGKLNGQLRGDLDRITMRSLEKDRTRRYGSPSELAADVRRHLRNEPVLASPPSATYRARKFVRRHRLGVGIASAALLVLVGFAVTMTVQARRIAWERDRADQEAETSDRVSEFLVSVFNVSDPGEARGNSVTAREILDQGALRIQRELKDEPLLRAKLMQTMGQVYSGLGLATRAESLFVAALEIRQRELGDEHPETIESLMAVATGRHFGGKSDETATFERVLALRERTFGPDHLETARAMIALGNVLGGVEGRRHLERGLSILEAELGTNHTEVGSCLNLIAVSLGMSGENAAALRIFKRALEIQVQALGSDHPALGAIHGNIGYALILTTRFDEARYHLDQAHAIRLKSLGPEHGRVAISLHSLGEVLRRQGYHAAARDSLRRALRILSRQNETTSWVTAEILHSLALTTWALGELTEADSLFLRVLQVHETHLFADHPDRVKALRDYAALLREMGRDDEAARIDARAQAIRDNLEPSSDAK